MTITYRHARNSEERILQLGLHVHEQHTKDCCPRGTESQHHNQRCNHILWWDSLQTERHTTLPFLLQSDLQLLLPQLDQTR